MNERDVNDNGRGCRRYQKLAVPVDQKSGAVCAMKVPGRCARPKSSGISGAGYLSLKKSKEFGAHKEMGSPEVENPHTEMGIAARAARPVRLVKTWLHPKARFPAHGVLNQAVKGVCNSGSWAADRAVADKDLSAAKYPSVSSAGPLAGSRGEGRQGQRNKLNGA
jgi:hypothetical protein